MQSPAWYFNRLRSMSAAEIAWRIKGVIIANLDLVRIPLGFYPKIDIGADLARADFEPGFRCSPADNGYGEMRSAEPFLAWERRLVASADAIAANRITFFDRVDQYLGDPPDWHRDFNAEKDAPRRLCNLLDYRDFDSAGDCKLVWEPNRHHQFVILARAWRVTRDERYARKVVELMCDWIEANPFGYGMNWKSALELGVRLINWVWALDLISDADVVSEDEWRKILQTVYLGMWESQRKFSRGSSANNHLVGEVAGVFVASCYFPQMPHVAAWRDESQRILEREIRLQSFITDGCTAEHAFGYQFFVLQFYTNCLLAGERSGNPFSDDYRERLHRMYRFMADICADTGRQPNFGDADDGYVLDLGERPIAAKQLIAVGGHVFDDAEIAAGVESESAFWMLGEHTMGQSAPATDRQSHAYEESGYFVMRAAATDSRPAARVFFDCAELGFGPIAAHGHADCLSFSLAVAGREILVDPGTYDYFTYPEWRNYFRSTPAHNTVTVDGIDQSELLGPFIWGERAAARLIEWSETDEFVRIVGEHDGYTRLPDPVVHRRSLTLFKQLGRIEIRDTLSARDTHKIQIHFHVAPRCAVERLAGGAVAVRDDHAELTLRSDDGELEVVVAGEREKRGWVSDGYHRREPGHAILLETVAKGITELGISIEIGGNRQQ